MKNNKDDDLRVNPVKEYEKPKIPTFDQMVENSEVMNRLPSRWIKRAAVIIAIGIIGIMGILAYRHVSMILEDLLPHGGGGWGMPDYFIWPTEQETLGVFYDQIDTKEFNVSLILDQIENLEKPV